MKASKTYALFIILNLSLILGINYLVNSDLIIEQNNPLQESDDLDNILIRYDTGFEEDRLESSAVLPARNAYAIIIGISDYSGTANDLDFCDDDASDTYSLLTNDFNYKPENIIFFGLPFFSTSS